MQDTDFPSAECHSHFILMRCLEVFQQKALFSLPFLSQLVTSEVLKPGVRCRIKISEA